MSPLSLLACIAVLWALLQVWLLPLVKERWKGEDLGGKMARAGVLVVAEKLRDLAAIGTVAVGTVLLLVALAGWLGSAGTVWPKAMIDTAAGLYQGTKAWADGYGTVLGTIGLVTAAFVLWRAARRARSRVGEVWAAQAQERFEAMRNDPALLEAARNDSALQPAVQGVDTAIARLRQQEQAEPPDEGALERARAALGQALSNLAIEMARGQVDFPAAVGKAAAAEAGEQQSGWQRLLGALSSKKFSEDMGLVKKPVGWVVTALLFVSLTGWAAEPLADSLRLAVNNLRVQLMQAQAQRDLDQALSQATPAPSTQAAPPAADVAAAQVNQAARLISRGFVREITRAPLINAAAARSLHAESEFARAALAQQQLIADIADDAALRLRADAHVTAEPAAVLKRSEEALHPALRDLQARQPARFASMLERLEARYSAPMSPLDAQGKLTARLLDEAFGAVDLKPEGELAKQSQKLLRDVGKDAAKTWANGALKQFLTDTLAGVARPEVRQAFHFEMSADNRAFLESLSAHEGRGWRAGAAGEREARMATQVAAKVAELHPLPEREFVREQLGGYERLFPAEDAPMVGGGGGGGNKSQARPSAAPQTAQVRATNFQVASRSFRVRGVLVGQELAGTALDATDLRWQVLPPGRPGAATRVALELRIAATPASVPGWVAIGSLDAGVLNQGLRYAADQRVVATTITGGDGRAVSRLTYLHPVLADTPLGCRVIEADRLVDTFTAPRPGRPVDTTVAELARDREQMYAWLGLVGLAEAVAARGGDSCPVSQVQNAAERRRLGPVRFSTGMEKALTQFVSARQASPAGGTDLLARAQRCAGAVLADVGRCLCEKAAPGGLPASYWFPEDHTSQVRERQARVDPQLSWLKPTPDRLGHFDFWTHTTFALRDGKSGVSDESSTAALDFPQPQLSALRQVVSRSVGAYAIGSLRSPTPEDFLGPLEEFVLAQRLARAALAGQLGRDFPLSRLLELERQTRRFVPAQPTTRWEATGDPRELLTTLQQADAGAAERYRAHQIDQVTRAQQRAPVCAAASL